MKQELAARIHEAVIDVAHARGIEGAIARPVIERPKKPEHGDFTTNVALTLAKRAACKPTELAAEIKARLEKDGHFARVDVAGPGFLNVKLAPTAFHEALSAILFEGRAYGRARAATGERINLEFVSANPTGPLHIAHGRGAITGDAVARILEAAGHRVTREYYVNDFGNQIKLLVESVLAKVAGRPDPEGGYGANTYIVELAEFTKKHYFPLIQRAIEINDARAMDDLARRLVALMVEGFGSFVGIRGTLRRLGVLHDVWTSEATMHLDGRVERAIDKLRDGEFIATKPEEKDAEFFLGNTKKLGDDKDRVVFKSDGGHTYFASDIAYHKDKLDRGFDRLIDVWGADHHGYIPRVRAALAALGLPSDKFEVVLVQMVSLLKDGEPYKMGKRLGNFITIDEVLDEIDEATGRPGAGSDVLRYYFCARRYDAQLEIDVELAKKQSLENPVYYLQYGHARLCAILRKAKEECGLDADELGTVDLSPVVHGDELASIAHLAEFPDVVADAAQERAPSKIVGFLTTLAQDFQSYYSRLKKENDTILPRTPERKDGSWKTRDGGAYARKVQARLAWVRAIRDVYAAGLALLGISAPERMDRPALSAISEVSAEIGDATGDETSDDEGS